MPASSLYAPLDLAGRSVLITGATAGIGQATALRFAELGCRVALVGRRTERLEALAADIASRFPATPPAVLVTLDVTDLAAVQRLPEQLAAEGMPEVDILVNNAGLALGVAGCDGNDMADVQTMLATNVTAPMALVRLFAPGMKERGAGHIVNISSVAAHECYQGGSVYCATKHAINAFTIASRHDLAGTPVRVTAISPGLVQTEFSVARFKGDEAKAAKVYENIIPLVAPDVADQVIYATTRPRHVQIADLLSYCTNQAHAKYVVERLGEGMGAPAPAAGP